MINDHRRIIAWQGWTLQIPRRWDAVKLEGDFTQGYALFADALRPRLGLRWQSPRRLKDPAHAVVAAMKAEVGQLAAAEATPIKMDDRLWQSPLLYREPAPPGRDILSVYNQTSGRLLQVAYHAHRRENILAGSLLPALGQISLDRAAQWAIFDLDCVIPAGMQLTSHRLNAGDLGLTFADRYNSLTIRQIAVAQLALQRQSMDRWIADQQRLFSRYHHPTSIYKDVLVKMNQHDVPGRSSSANLRFRYRPLWNQPRRYFTFALHDADRDRLILLHGTDESLLREIAGTIGALHTR